MRHPPHKYKILIKVRLNTSTIQGELYNLHFMRKTVHKGGIDCLRIIVNLEQFFFFFSKQQKHVLRNAKKRGCTQCIQAVYTIHAKARTKQIHG